MKSFWKLNSGVAVFGVAGDLLFIRLARRLVYADFRDHKGRGAAAEPAAEDTLIAKWSEHVLSPADHRMGWLAPPPFSALPPFLDPFLFPYIPPSLPPLSLFQSVFLSVEESILSTSFQHLFF